MTRIEGRGLTVRYTVSRRATRALDAVDLTIDAEQSVGLVGESGSGKSTLARTLVGLITPAAGTVTIDGQDIGKVSRSDRRSLLHGVQMVFQDPYRSLNPRMSVGQSIAEAVRVGGQESAAAVSADVVKALSRVQLPAEYAGRLPRELSGGQRQRVSLARALAAQPSVLIADEVTSALDVSVQGTMLNLLRELRQELRLSLLFVSHNLAVVRYMCDSIAVMHAGRIVEQGRSADVLAHPRHPYTAELIGAVPRLHGHHQFRIETSAGDTDESGSRPSAGCGFAPQCPLRRSLTAAQQRMCDRSVPTLVPADGNHRGACHHSGTVT